MARKKILVVGDVFLDRYFNGPATRISPEAPVTVVWCPQGQVDFPGGAGNVAAAAADLGAKVGLLGAVGDDPDAGWLGAILDSRGVWHNLVPTPRRTPVKVRVTAAGRHLARADVEDTRVAYPREFFSTLRERFNAVLPEVGVVVLSDYCKGALPQFFAKTLIDLCRAADVPVLADPKRDDLCLYDGCLAVTPNWREAVAAVSGLIELRGGYLNVDAENDNATATDLVQMVAEVVPKTAHVIVTRGAFGCSWFDREKARTLHLPPAVNYAVDVTGAGDVFVAALAVGLVERGDRFDQAVRLANAAAGLSVTHFGTGPVDRDEVFDLVDAGMGLAEKLMDAADAAAWSERRKARGERVVFTNGCFDVLHPGHMKVLRGAKAYGDRLVVAVNDDHSVRRLKGEGRPLHALEDRMDVLAALDMVDAVVPFADDTPEKLVRLLKPDVLVKGAEYRGKRVPGADYVAGRGGRVEFVEMLPGHSTTRIVNGGTDGTAKQPAG